MIAPMYAALMHLTFDPELAPAAAKAFQGELLPSVRVATGFRGGYWVDPAAGKGFGFMLFDTEEQAQSASVAGKWAAPGVTVDKVDVRRVAATA